MTPAQFIEVSAEVRYWEDAAVNGEFDDDGSKIPFRSGNCWTPTIRLEDGLIMGWPQGTAADVHYKVCDQGEYWLLDGRCARIAKWKGFYVPDDFLCHADQGYGDYIIMKINENGVIQKWRRPQIYIAKDNESQGWKPL